ncbi:hypothetical protein SAMN04488109_6732 [Chryseolinea serpens]|uniref:Uncharacterized protein n=1 Tax=Chryseolinea serpens TaxID=947013 RepID=A0A1M5XLY2_9BACT|nr:hypothetical protein [Chryseolinea serpens]SHI00865.1 hypothetical protein SAMN04488109_6732 [Chryseolinea serpens]
MELLESNDPKLELLKKSAKHRQDLEDEVRLISAKTERIITNALIIGGTLAAAYVLVRQFSGPSKKRKKVKSQKLKVVQAAPADAVEVEEEESFAPGIVSQVGQAIASQATVFLLGLAKEKLSEFLQGQFEKKEEEKQ